MKKISFPLIAVVFTLPLLAGLIWADTLLPLLTRLFMTEFGVILSGFGVYFGVRSIMANGFTPLVTLTTSGCVLMAIKFIFIGIALWSVLYPIPTA